MTWSDMGGYPEAPGPGGLAKRDGGRSDRNGAKGIATRNKDATRNRIKNKKNSMCGIVLCFGAFLFLFRFKQQTLMKAIYNCIFQSTVRQKITPFDLVQRDWTSLHLSIGRIRIIESNLFFWIKNIIIFVVNRLVMKGYEGQR